jgi:dolichol-phosphate mannosyltransferase
MKRLILIPTYNEISNIARLIEKIMNIDLNFDILVIDDNSSDGTGKIVDELVKKYLRVKIMHREKKLGLGTAYIQGFKYALEEKYDYVFTMDADFSHNPDCLPDFLDKLKEYDFVVGSRYIRHGGVSGWPWQRKLLSRLGNIYAELVTGLRINDCTSGFMGIRKEVIEKSHLDEIKSEGYGFLIECKYRAQKNGVKLKEIPIVFVDRVAGKSKISRKIIFEAIILVWKLYLGVR